MFVILVPLAIWIYTLVFAFSSLWFTHYCLGALQALRAQAVAVMPVPAPAPAPSAEPEAPLAIPTAPAHDLTPPDQPHP